MAQEKESRLPTTASQDVGTKRGGMPHLIDGIGPGKGVITKRSLSGNILPDTSKIVPEGAKPGYQP